MVGKRARTQAAILHPLVLGITVGIEKDVRKPCFPQIGADLRLRIDGILLPLLDGHVDSERPEIPGM